MSRRVKLEHKQIKLLSNDQRSASFDEEALSMNKMRKNITQKLDTTLVKNVPSKAARSKSTNNVTSESLQTKKLQHILQLNSDDETILNINKALSRSRKVLVLTGAGISCNAGIPDFRSSDGLYNLVKKEHPNVSLGSGKEMFDISLFRDELKISVWATFMEKLYSSCRLAKPTKTHKFIAHLKDRGKLLRCYTQNIDGLEETLGLELSSEQPVQEDSLKKENLQKSLIRSNSCTAFSNAKWRNYDVVQLHGDLNKLSCTRCFHVFNWNRYWARSFRRGELPVCPHCEAIQLRRSQQGKRVVDHHGMLRPNIVLYGENHPSGDIISQGLNLDILRGKPDFFIIMGTSLKVDGVKKVVKQMSKQVHERGGLVILVNKSSVGDSTWNGCIDYQIWEDCDEWVTFLNNQEPDFFKSQKEVNKLRQLKREASELRKQKLLETRKQIEQQSLSTPPTTPTREEKNLRILQAGLSGSSSSEGEESDSMKRASLQSLKRKLLPPTNKMAKNKKAKLQLKEVIVSDGESDDDQVMKLNAEFYFKKENNTLTTSS
ncbi:similar to Saccharomyces cerevisiae YOR025W HST3 Member of the Sir2 family of NAD(+)-dependent protein deacetylases [Maudiozyma barnettii]|uniref:Similar to Saccharomyces cerevisiae YOR025W HST3 Member of the Sir2 family of NAD(+)-dependent protein deacetylases n=1 Tax=Maudiozyma barnettii TaxID=61262 RepID=A0A8H2ZJ95_9SACH|nr:NAD-dependent histone deacetylase HST3 [Kazachstania barnettii]CAB4256307.1 similar to Saccharomyces cerevisiae YOR025W HST3 Member of the Sir2 family of NAD(+)-dependent protein deacetylases [Kazachstania barnettii]CAD1784916.1 similar to Saccharomyces cerevisiae YOR025W HST3 Member of the Sir2 family of NAD(+)-dependent protein deacetylases [Kazachstania barnettii]